MSIIITEELRQERSKFFKEHEEKSKSSKEYVTRYCQPIGRERYMNSITLLEKKYKDMLVKFAPWTPFQNIPIIANYANRKGFTHFSASRPKIKLYAHYDSGKIIEVGTLKEDITALPDYKNYEKEKKE